MPGKQYTTRALVLNELPNNLPGEIYKRTALNGTLAAAGTVVTVDALTGFPDMGDLLIGSEYVHYEGTSAAGTTFTTLTRGAWNTTAGTHADDDPVYNGYLDRTIEKMTAFVDMMLSRRYQLFPSYTPAGSCPESIEWICRNLSAYESRIQMGIERNVAEGNIESSRYDRTIGMLDALSKGEYNIPEQTGTDSLIFGTTGVGTSQYDTNEAPLGQQTILRETVLVTNAGTTYINGRDYGVHWDEEKQKWIVVRGDSTKIVDSGTATYKYSWLKSDQGLSPLDQQRTNRTNRGYIL